MLINSVRDSFIDLVSKNFEDKLEPKKRIRVVADEEMFLKGEDKFVWGQAQGKIQKNFSVYFDDEFICSFTESDSQKKALLNFLKGFKEAYQSGKVRLDPLWKIAEAVKQEEEEKKQQKQARKKEIEDTVATTPEEKAAKHIVKKLENL